MVEVPEASVVAGRVNVAVSSPFSKFTVPPLRIKPEELAMDAPRAMSSVPPLTVVVPV